MKSQDLIGRVRKAAERLEVLRMQLDHYEDGYVGRCEGLLAYGPLWLPYALKYAGQDGTALVLEVSFGFDEPGPKLNPELFMDKESARKAFADLLGVELEPLDGGRYTLTLE